VRKPIPEDYYSQQPPKAVSSALAQQQEQIEQHGGIVTTQKIGRSIRSHGIEGADTFVCGDGEGDTVTDYNEAEGDIATPDCENINP
jgi:hypothetical protein